MNQESDEGWPFDQAANVAAITTRQVINDGFPILTVIHYLEDHSWAFLCGTTDKAEDGRVIGMKTAHRIDPTLAGVSNLEPGHVATRERVGGPWTISKNKDE